MNGYLFELSKKDERRINITLMLVALAFCAILAMKIFERLDMEETQNKTETESVSENITSLAHKKAAPSDTEGRYNIKLR